MPTVFDVLLVFLVVVVASLFQHFWTWPRFRADIAANIPGARGRAYRRGMAGQWGIATLMFVLWFGTNRSVDALRLGVPDGWRLIVSALLVALMVAFVIYQLVAVSRLNTERREQVRDRFGDIAFLLPHTASEFRQFLLLSCTAGICEELIYRGYLVWFFAHWSGVPLAFLATIVLFGVGHAYQGTKGALKAAAAGAVMAGIVMITGWLVPAMIIHALLDASSGTMGYWLLRGNEHVDSATAHELEEAV